MTFDTSRPPTRNARRALRARLLALLATLALLASTLCGVPARAADGADGPSAEVAGLLPADPSPESAGVPAATADAASLAEGVRVQASQAGVGWRAPVEDGGSSGGDGSGRALQALRLEVTGPVGGSIEYRVRKAAWSAWSRDGEDAGTPESAVTAFEARTSGTVAERFDLYYRACSSVGGWLGWARAGETAGSEEGVSVPIEAVQVRLVPKGGASPQDGGAAASPTFETPTLVFTARGDGRDEYAPVRSGGEVGSADVPLKDIRAWLEGTPGGGSIRYRASVGGGWTDWKDDGESVGGWSMEPVNRVQFSLTAPLSDYYDLWYRTRVSGVGWMDYAQGPYSAGVSTNRLAVEAIQLTLVPKGAPAPGPTAEPCLTDISRYDCGSTTDRGRAIVDACFAIPSPGGGLCAKWVSQVIDRATGVYLWLDADDMYYRIRPVDRSEMVPGMALSVSTHSHTYLGSIYGHVAIYIGHGLIMDNAGYIRTATMDSWLDYYTDRVPVHIGWL